MPRAGEVLAACQRQHPRLAVADGDEGGRERAPFESLQAGARAARRQPAKPRLAKPASIIAQVAGSGTESTVRARPPPAATSDSLS